MGTLIARIIEVQMKTYNDMVNKKLEDLENKFTLQLNQVEDQVTDLQIQQLELANAIATPSRVTANLANSQQRFENFVLAFNRQLLEQQIITTRRSIEKRKLILSQNAHATQLAIKEYNARKLILQALKKLKNIPSLRNDTIYRNQITEGIIYNTEIYRLTEQNHHNFTKWVKEHSLTIRNQSQRLEQFDKLRKVLKDKNRHREDMKILQELAAITIKPIETLEFTNKFEPIPFPGVDVGLGISGLIIDVSDAGVQIIDTGSRLVENVIDKGVSVISEPIKIIIIAASILGEIIVLLIACKYLYKEKQEKANINMAMNINFHPHTWKKYDEYYGGTEVTN